jgi:hypothetical protein
MGYAQSVSDQSCDAGFATANAAASTKIYGIHPQDPLNGCVGGHCIDSTTVKKVINVAQNGSVVQQRFLAPTRSAYSYSATKSSFYRMSLLLPVAASRQVCIGLVVEALLIVYLPGQRADPYRHKVIRSTDRPAYSVRFSWSLPSWAVVSVAEARLVNTLTSTSLASRSRAISALGRYHQKCG